MISFFFLLCILIALLIYTKQSRKREIAPYLHLQCPDCKHLFIEHLIKCGARSGEKRTPGGVLKGYQWCSCQNSQDELIEFYREKVNS